MGLNNTEITDVLRLEFVYDPDPWSRNRYEWYLFNEHGSFLDFGTGYTYLATGNIYTVCGIEFIVTSRDDETHNKIINTLERLTISSRKGDLLDVLR